MIQKRILGIDPGLATLGYGCLTLVADTQQIPTLLDFGVITTPAHTPMGDRLAMIYDDLHTLLPRMEPDLVALEKLFFYKMSHTISVAQARGIVLLVLSQLSIPLVEFTPAQIKQALTGYGNAAKNEVQQAVQRELALDYLPKPDDAADALAIALTAGRFN